MIPKIKFINSSTYDKILHKYHWQRYEENEIEETRKMINEIEVEWNKIAEESLKAISEVSGLEWRETEIKCYFVKHFLTGGMSEPLTIKLPKDTSGIRVKMILTTMMHELVHIIIIQNWIGCLPKTNDGSKRFYPRSKGMMMKKYAGETNITKIHLLVFAILLPVLERVFDKETVSTYNSKYKKHKEVDYLRALDIVETEGKENIIKDMIT